jgi:hypothetical protein
MSTLQWHFGNLDISFDKDGDIPSYISFEKSTHVNHEDDSDNEVQHPSLPHRYLQGGAREDWESIHNRYRVVATAEVTENIKLNNRDVQFEQGPKTGEWGLQNMPLPRQIVFEMLDQHRDAQAVLTPENWEATVRQVATKMRGFEEPLECAFTGPGEQKWVVKRMRDIGAMTPQQQARLESSPGRIKTDMFWFAQRQWDFVKAVMDLDEPRVNALLKPEVFEVLQRANLDNLPVHCKDLRPRDYPELFDADWVIGEEGSSGGNDGVSDGGGGSPGDGGSSPGNGGGGSPGNGGGGSPGNGGGSSPGNGSGSSPHSEEQKSPSSEEYPFYSPSPVPGTPLGFQSGSMGLGRTASSAAENVQFRGAIQPGRTTAMRQRRLAAPASSASDRWGLRSPAGDLSGFPEDLEERKSQLNVPQGPPVSEQNRLSRSAAHVSGRSVSGRSVSGRSVSGRSVSGRSVSGRSVSGRSESGRSVSGRSERGNRAAILAERFHEPEEVVMEHEDVPVIQGGDGMSSETGLYGGMQRWVGNFKEIDLFTKPLGYPELMHKKFTSVINRFAKLPEFTYIVQTLYQFQNNVIMLYPLLYLLENNMFMATKEELMHRHQKLSPNFDETLLLKVCKESWVELKKPKEDFRELLNKYQLYDPSTNQELFYLGYSKVQRSNEIVTVLHLSQRDLASSAETLINYLPVILYQISLLPGSQALEFKFGALSPDVLQVVKTVYGPVQVSTKTKLKQRLLTLQEDLGFYKLNKASNTYLENRPGKTTMIVYRLNSKSPLIEVDDIETWITGYIINNTNDLYYSIKKHTDNILQYPWNYVAMQPTQFEGNSHLKIELICRRKIQTNLKGVGFSLLSYFLSYFHIHYQNLSMVCIDVARAHGDMGLPDVMFSQLLHERLKFQRTFDMKQILELPSVKALYKQDGSDDTTQEFADHSQLLQDIFDIHKHAPYEKVYKPNMQAAVLEQEFINLPENLDLQNPTAEVQEILQRHAKTLTFARPMFTSDDLQSIYQRFIQSDEEDKKRVARGKLEAY